MRNLMTCVEAKEVEEDQWMRKLEVTCVEEEEEE